MNDDTPAILREVPRDLPIPVWGIPSWDAAYPWLAHGITHAGRRESEPDFDLRLFGDPSVSEAPARVRRLASEAGFARSVLSRQVHGGRVLVHAEVGGNPSVAPDADGHTTDVPGVLLLVTVADCVPVFLVDPVRRAVGMVHAGWRSAAAGIVDAAVGLLRDRYGSVPGDLVTHLGPSICGDCYEVGPEVHAAFELPVPPRPTPIDLRSVLASRLRNGGVGRVSVSGHCTRCGDSPFFSHRAGDAARQIAFVGIRDG